MSDEFDKKNKAQWEAALVSAFPEGIPQSASWTDLGQMISILNHFCAKDLNNTMLALRGGMSIQKVARSKEAGCIELQPTPGSAYVSRPDTLHFEHISNSPWNSFFLLSTQELQPSDVYAGRVSDYEELLELPDGEYLDRSHLDQGSLGYDESGADIPIPDPHRLVVRYFSGKFLIVAKRSLWNLTTSTYDGRHAKMTPAEIRQQIESALSPRHC